MLNYATGTLNDAIAAVNSTEQRAISAAVFEQRADAASTRRSRLAFVYGRLLKRQQAFLDHSTQ